MKRVITLALAVVLLLTLASCGKKEAEPTVAPTEAPVIEATEAAPETQAPSGEPEWEPGVSRANYGEAVYAYLDAGTEVNVIGQYGDYYVIEGEEIDLLVYNEYVRLDNEEDFEGWNGYAKSNTEVFDNVKLEGEAIATLKRNTKVTVLEGKGNWLLIEWDEGKGYVAANMVSKWFIQNKSSSGGAYYGNAVGGAGTPGDGTGVNLGDVAAADVDVKLQLLGAYYGPEQEADFEADEGTILADSTEAYITLLFRDDEVKVTEYDDEFAVIWLEGELTAKLPRFLLYLEGDEEYESWTAYSRWNGIIYEENQLRNEHKKLYTNKEMTVIDELPNCYVVEFEGEIGYIEKDKVSETKIRTSSGSGDGYYAPGGGAAGGGNWGYSNPIL